MLNVLIALFALCAYASAPSYNEVDLIVEKAIEERTLPGAVILIGGKQVNFVEKAYGERGLSIPNNMDTLYDLASLTKVVATATAVMILEEQGKLGLQDKLSHYYDLWMGEGKDQVTIEDLLRHQAGLPASTRSFPGEPYKEFLNRVLGTPLQYNPRTQTVYSDLGFIILGDLVERVSGMTLNEFTRSKIYLPLKMISTTFLVSSKGPCAPTLENRICIPHDHKAFAQFPHSLGHAGLFSTGRDVGRFAQMFLNFGELDGVRILQKKSVEKMTTLPGLEIRGLGWDVLSVYSTAPRGEVFPKGLSYGHTGFTGTTLWIDPVSETYYVFLSNRVLLGEERTARPFTELRKSLSTAIGRTIYESSSNSKSLQ